jgi:hypothetical protein
MRRGAIMPTLSISTEKVCYVVVKARQFDVKVAPEWLDDGSNPVDDGVTRVLEDYKDAPTLMELRSYLHAMNEDELEESDRADPARSRRLHDRRVGRPDGRGGRGAGGRSRALSARYSAARRLNEFGLSCVDFEAYHL